MQAAIKFRGKRVGVEKLKKTKNKSESFIVVADHDEYLGIVRYVSEEASQDLQVGQKVYFGNQFQTIKMNSADICVMEDSNVLAVVNEEKQATVAPQV
jgi:co-chaperonin GroES (HSP10)